MDFPLRKTLADVVDFFQTRQVPFALIGGLAVSLRSQPRVTADVDIVISADMDRALEISRNLTHTSFRPLFEDIEDVVTRTFLLPLRHRTTNVKVDVAIGLTGFEYEVVRRANPLRVGECEAPVASAEDLLIMKLLAGRPQDEQDIQSLIVAQGDTLDWDYCFRMATDLGDAVGQNLAMRVRGLRNSLDFE